MSRTLTNGCLHLGFSDSDTKQEAGPESARAGKRDAKGRWETETPRDTYVWQTGGSSCVFQAYPEGINNILKHLEDSNDPPSRKWGFAQESSFHPQGTSIEVQMCPQQTNFPNPTWPALKSVLWKTRIHHRQQKTDLFSGSQTDNVRHTDITTQQGGLSWTTTPWGWLTHYSPDPRTALETYSTAVNSLPGPVTNAVICLSWSVQSELTDLAWDTEILIGKSA